MTCKCHSDLMYASLTTCPKCGHNSLDKGKTWEGCERRKCGYQRTYAKDVPAADTADKSDISPKESTE